MNACPRAPCIKHNRVEDAAVVRRPTQTGKDPGEIQERVPELGLAQPCDSKQGQEEKRHGRLHLHSGG